MKNKILLLLLFSTVFLTAQTETEKWGKKDNPYLINETAESRDYRFGGESAVSFFTNSAISLYWFFISDQDGDNCPFYPSCSHFFLESVKMYGLVQGTFMFGDRFTRDMNFINREKKYPVIKNKRFYDPPALYTLNIIPYPPVK